MTKTEISNLKTLIDRFCRNEVNNNHCKDGDCEFCPVNAAYDRISESTDEDEDEE